jgi:hypothetical protein
MVGGRPCLCDRHHSLVELLRQFFQGAIAVLILQKPPRPPVLCFRDLDSLGECTSWIDYHGRSAPTGQQIIWLKRLLLS